MENRLILCLRKDLSVGKGTFRRVSWASKPGAESPLSGTVVGPGQRAGPVPRQRLCYNYIAPTTQRGRGVSYVFTVRRRATSKDGKSHSAANRGSQWRHR